MIEIIKYHDDVIDKFGHANINKFPKDFNVDEFLDEFDELNVCDLCSDIQNSATEMFWQDTTGDGTYHECMNDEYTALCDACFYKLGKEAKPMKYLI